MTHGYRWLRLETRWRQRGVDVAPTYLRTGLVLAAGQSNDPGLVRTLQRDLRQLGYLASGIDGNFGRGTAAAVRALQYDLQHNSGSSTRADGAAPVAIADYNLGRVGTITGVLDQDLAQCLADLLADDNVTKLPAASDPAAENERARAAIAAAASTLAPTPYLVAIVRQESQGKHFAVPSQGDEDSYVVVGLDHGDKAAPDAVTSRGYGIGQYTLFHHPPRPEEVQAYILDPVANVANAYLELKSKFDGYVAGKYSYADDRSAEHPLLPLRLCKYRPTDPTYMRDCRNCALAARKVNITRGTPVYAGASISYQPDQYYKSATYVGVPDRADFLCDWPYAVRRYNGSGNDSYHYQTRVLLNLLLQNASDGS